MGRDKVSLQRRDSAGSDPIDNTAQPRMLAPDRTVRNCRLPIGEYRGADYEQADRYRSGTDLNSGRPLTRMTCGAGCTPDHPI
jgi:hypothetical protein